MFQHPSYSRLAELRLLEDYQAADLARLQADVPGAVSGRGSVRLALGHLLIRAGARLVMPPTPSAVR
jgi:hypothetical protein